jgi:hypothetical protein
LCIVARIDIDIDATTDGHDCRATGPTKLRLGGDHQGSCTRTPTLGINSVYILVMPFTHTFSEFVSDLQITYSYHP